MLRRLTGIFHVECRMCIISVELHASFAGIDPLVVAEHARNGFNFYHQYAQLDFTVLDKRLGTLEELRQLVADAHELGMYVIIDVVESLDLQCESY